jgi:pyridoxamine 5'-phosphate oxidase family protein
MSHFTAAEIAYLTSQPLGRLATVDADGSPNVVPVSYRFNETLDSIDIAGYNMEQSKKYKNILRDGRVAFVVDDVVSLDPYQARAVEIRGQAESAPHPTRTDLSQPGAHLIRIRPTQIISWGVETGPYQRNSRKINEEP